MIKIMVLVVLLEMMVMVLVAMVIPLSASDCLARFESLFTL